MNQLNIDPTELRGIGIQINKLESRAVKAIGHIGNLISNMKSEQNKNQKFLNDTTDCNKMILTKFEESKSHQVSSIVNTRNEEIISTKQKKPKTVIDFFKSNKESLNSKKQTSSNFISNISHQSLDIKMSHVDPEFLDALPADLRQEIESELKANEHQNNFSPVEHEDTGTIDITVTEESSKLYQHVNVDQMKEFVEEWVTTENKPKTCDSIMVSEYVCNLVKDSKTEDAYEIIRKLYR